MKLKEILIGWYLGDKGEKYWDPVTEETTIIRPPSRHWTARFASYFINPLLLILEFFKKEWKVLIPIFLTALNFIYTHSIDKSIKKNDKEYSRCEIQEERINQTTFRCLKGEP